MSLSQDDISHLTQKALSHAQDSHYNKSEELLSFILDHFSPATEVSLSELSVLNNLAFVHQKTGNYYKSLSLLSRAQSFKPTTEEGLSCYIATLMNLSSINSFLSSYHLSLQQAFRAVELCENEKFPELKSLAYFNLSSILMTLNRLDKATFYLRESHTIAKSVLGNKHKLSLLTSKATGACLNPDAFHCRVRSSGYTSTNVSFSTNTSKFARYQLKIVNDDDDPKSRFNITTKVAAINKTGRVIVRNGLPYVKELKSSKRIDASLLKSPKKEEMKNKKFGKLNKSLYFQGKKIGIVLNRIHTIFKAIEGKMEEFLYGCKEVMNEVFDEDKGDRLESVLKIQRWIRKVQGSTL